MAPDNSPQLPPEQELGHSRQAVPWMGSSAAANASPNLPGWASSNEGKMFLASERRWLNDRRFRRAHFSVAHGRLVATGSLNTPGGEVNFSFLYPTMRDVNDSLLKLWTRGDTEVDASIMAGNVRTLSDVVDVVGRFVQFSAPTAEPSRWYNVADSFSKIRAWVDNKDQTR